MGLRPSPAGHQHQGTSLEPHCFRCHQSWAKEAGPFSPHYGLAGHAKPHCEDIKAHANITVGSGQLALGWMGGPGSSQWADQITSALSPLMLCPHPPACHASSVPGFHQGLRACPCPGSLPPSVPFQITLDPLCNQTTSVGPAYTSRSSNPGKQTLHEK